jgi:putative nucleotidyltransferase with HDIG domain
LTSPPTGSRSGELRWLFDALATGGREPIITPDEWEAHLVHQLRLQQTEITRWFLAALRDEWLPPQPPTPLCDTLTGEVRAYLRSRQGPWATVWGHTWRVGGMALWLAEQNNLDPEVAYLTALFHDAGKLDEEEIGQPHPQIGAKMAERRLRGKLPPNTVRLVHDAIWIHPDRPPTSWKVAGVLHDADKLDKIGAAGLARRLSETDNHTDACQGAQRTLDEADSFPALALSASEALLRPKLAFACTLKGLIQEVCE